MKKLLSAFAVAALAACLVSTGCGVIPFGGAPASSSSTSSSSSVSSASSSSSSSTSSSSKAVELPAANDLVQVSGITETSEPEGDLALSIRVKGLKGGTADADIDEGRANAIVTVASILQDFENREIQCELSSFAGGTAANSIPSDATAVVVIDSDIRATLEQTANDYIAGLKNTFSGIESNITLEITEVDMPAAVVSNDDRRNALWFMTEIVDGVNTWQKDASDQVESSSNLGVFNLGVDGVSATTSVRSTSADRETEIVNKQVALAEESGYKAEVVKVTEL